MASRTRIPLTWDNGAPWELRVDVVPLNGAPKAPRLTMSTRCACRAGCVAATSASRSPMRRSSRQVSSLPTASRRPFATMGNHSLIVALADEGSIEVPAVEVDELLRELHTLPAVPPIDLPESLASRRSVPTPQAGRPTRAGACRLVAAVEGHGRRQLRLRPASSSTAT